MATSNLLLNQFNVEKCLPILSEKAAIFDSMWSRLNVKPFLAYRIIIGIFGLAYVIFDITWETINFYKHNIGYWFIYATNWAFVIFSFSMAILAANCVIRFFKPRYEFNDNYCHGIFLLYTITAVSTLTVDLVYWVALNAEKGLMSESEARIKHTIPTIIILVDLMINRIVLELAHVIYPIICGVIYIIFNAIYYHSGGTRYDGKPYVYEAVNWTHTESATTACLIVIVFTLIIHNILFCITFIKFLLKESYSDIKKSVNSDSVCLVK